MVWFSCLQNIRERNSDLESVLWIRISKHTVKDRKIRGKRQNCTYRRLNRHFFLFKIYNIHPNLYLYWANILDPGSKHNVFVSTTLSRKLIRICQVYINHYNLRRSGGGAGNRLWGGHSLDVSAAELTAEISG